MRRGCRINIHIDISYSCWTEEPGRTRKTQKRIKTYATDGAGLLSRAKHYDRCLHRQKVELSQEMRREKTNTRRSKLTLENAHIKEKKGRKNEQQRCGYFMHDVD